MLRVIFALLLLISTYAHAEKPGYGGIQWGIHKTDFIDFSDPTFGNVTNEAAEANVLGVYIGYKLWKYLGVEARGGLGLGIYDFLSNTDLGEFRTDVELKYYGSAYVRPEYRFEKVAFYTLLGYTQVSLNTESTGPINDAFEEGGFSYGLGVGLITKDNVSFNLEFLRLVEADSFNIDGLNVGMEFRL